MWDDYTLLNEPDAKLWGAINSIIEKAMLTYDKVFASLALNYKEEDVDARVSNFVFKAGLAIEEHGLKEKLENHTLKARSPRRLSSGFAPSS